MTSVKFLNSVTLNLTAGYNHFGTAVFSGISVSAEQVPILFYTPGTSGFAKLEVDPSNGTRYSDFTSLMQLNDNGNYSLYYISELNTDYNWRFYARLSYNTSLYQRSTPNIKFTKSYSTARKYTLTSSAYLTAGLWSTTETSTSSITISGSGTSSVKYDPMTDYDLSESDCTVTPSTELVVLSSLSSLVVSDATNLTSILAALQNVAFVFDTSTVSQLEMTLLYTSDMTNCLVNCSNNGLCALVNGTNFVCVCAKYYYDDACETDLRPCSRPQCLNYGTCTNIQTDQTLPTPSGLTIAYAYTFKCECPTGYYGTHCEYQTDFCSNVTCTGNGLCQYFSNYSTYCHCYSGYTGDNCQSETTDQQFVSLKNHLIHNFPIDSINLIVCCINVFNYN